MRFFGIENGELDSSPQAIRAFRQELELSHREILDHYDRIWDRLPSDLRLIQGAMIPYTGRFPEEDRWISIHDALVEEFHYVRADDRFILILARDNEETGDAVRCRLIYEGDIHYAFAGVQRVVQDCEDVIFHEADVEDHDRFVHRLLLNSGMELHLSFRDFKFHDHL